MDVRFLDLDRTGWRRFIPMSLRTPYVEVLNDFALHIDQTTYLIPQKHIHNGSSWPFFMRWLFNPFGSSVEEGALHDFMYKYQCYMSFKPPYVKAQMMHIVRVDRKRADRIWLRGNLQFNHDGTAWGRFVYATRFVMPIIGYVGLRLFGWWQWQQCQMNSIQNNIDWQRITEGRNFAW